MSKKRRLFISLSAVLMTSILFHPTATADGEGWNSTADPSLDPLKITVYKSPTCGCCGDWVTHLEQHRFEVTAINRSDMSAIKKELGVPVEMQSCHTAVVNGYVIEGHVPATDIRQLVERQDSSLGLAVPRMPVGSPGMEMGTRKDAFKVISFDRDGGTQVVKEYSDY